MANKRNYFKQLNVFICFGAICALIIDGDFILQPAIQPGKGGTPNDLIRLPK
jgi:hypothetical protein